MTYRELLKLYKEGKLNQEDRQKIAEDIEKQDAISDYLFDEQNFEKEEDSFEAEEKNPEKEKSAEHADTLLLIQKSIRKSFVKMGISVGCAVLTAVLLCVFVLPSFVSLFFYNPNQIMGKNPQNPQLTTDRLSLDMTVYSEMFLPANIRGTVIFRGEGWGNYRVTVPQLSTFDGRRSTAEGYLSRNQLHFYTPDILKAPTGNAFFLPEEVKNTFVITDSETHARTGPAGDPEEALKALEKLDENAWYTGYVSLKNITDYADFIRWYEEKDPFSGGTWCAVYTDTEDGSLLGNNMGFAFHLTAAEKYWDEEKYPRLAPLSFDSGSAEESREHFTSMLKYLRDHPQIIHMMTGNQHTGSENLFDLMLNSIEKDGLRTYGFAIQTKKDTLLELSRDPRVSYIYTEPVS